MRVRAFSQFILMGALSCQADAGDWTKFQNNRSLTGVVRDAVFKGSNAGQLAIQWQSNTGAPVWASPIVQYQSRIQKTLVYVGNNGNVFGAYDGETGERVWYFRATGPIFSTAVLWGDSVWVGSGDRYLRKLDAVTGAIRCQYVTEGAIQSSPMIVDPDGAGPVGAMVYFGDSGLAGGDDGGHVAAVNVTDCKEVWRFDGYGEKPGEARGIAGTWTPISFAPGSSKRPPLVLFGGSSPDNGVYAINAIDGNAASNLPSWRVQASPHINDLDVGAGITVGHVTPSTPGGLGFVSAKNSIMRALDLDNGNQRWEFDMALDSPGTHGSRSTAAYAQGALFFGHTFGLYALNASSGRKIWKTADFGLAADDVIASPSISFPADLGNDLRDSAIFFGDMAGNFYAVNGSGRKVWSYQTGGPVFSSAAITGNRVFVGSSDGFLYAFGIGGSVSAKPETVIENPGDQSEVPNPGPGALLTITGRASDDHSVKRVLVGIKNNTAGRWWDPANSVWVPIFTQFEAALGQADAKSTSWQASFPVAFEGGDIYVQAEAVDSDGQHDAEVAKVRIKIPTLGNPPTGSFTFPGLGKAVISYFPSGRSSYMVTLSGTAKDTLGANPGIRRVWIQIRNSDHTEFYCGLGGCPGLPAGTLWRPSAIMLDANVSSPGATSTNWSIQFPTYDHPHNYRFRIRPVDMDGESSPTWIESGKLCVRDPGPVSDCYGG